MATTQDYINQLKIDKQNLVSMLNNMGVEANNTETFTSLTPKVGKIVTDPILQDKSIKITENGTQTIQADEGYDGLNNVEVTTNVSGGAIPEKGFIINSFDADGYATEITVLGLTSIPDNYFRRYGQSYVTSLLEHLKKINLPSDITSLGTSAFSSNSEVREINLSDTIESIGGGCFVGCNRLKLSKLPNSLTTIPTNAFQSCWDLTLEENLPDSVTVIGQYAFYGCTSLAIRTIPDGVTDIPNRAIARTGIIQISMKNVKTIAGSSTANLAFESNTGLKAVWIGSAITTLQRYVFNGCSSLQKIFIDLPRATVETLAGYNYAFMNKTANVGIVVCNDDEGFMSKEEFDAIDWATYTE